MNWKTIKIFAAIIMPLMITVSCDKLDEPLENEQLEGEVDYTRSEDMVLIIQGAYAEFNFIQWETFPLIGVRGDDVNAAGDQVPLVETDEFRYDRNFWMYNSAWLNLYSDIINWNGAIEAIERYKAGGADAALADQYIAEIKVMRAFETIQLARLWGQILIVESSDITGLAELPLSSFEDVMEYVSSDLEDAIPILPSIRPNQRTDIENGITRYTALAVKAMAELELKNWQGVVDATSEIINSGLFELYPDYYQAFNIPGKNSNESLYEFQYSDFGLSSGTTVRYLWNFFGPSGRGFVPVLDGARGGWGFWEPSQKYVKFMMERGEQERLIGSVIFTPQGVDDLEADPEVGPIPNFITSQIQIVDALPDEDERGYLTPEGDAFGASPRYKFLSAKQYLPTTQLTPGRNNYGENNNFRVIRYAEVLLMHAEALVNGASSGSISADEAVNIVRDRAGMAPLSGVTLDDVLDEKFAELAMEWGIRFYDLVRHNRTQELDYGGRTYSSPQDRFIPYPLPQLDLLPQLNEASNNGS